MSCKGWHLAPSGLSRHSHMLPRGVHSFDPFQLSSFRLHGLKAGPESFTAMLPIFFLQDFAEAYYFRAQIDINGALPPDSDHFGSD